MGTVDAPFPAEMAGIDVSSIHSMSISGTDVTFRNRAGVIVGVHQVKNPDSALTKAIRRIGSADAGYKDVLVKDWYRPLAPNLYLPAPSTNAGDFVTAMDWSPDGVYLAMGMEAAPSIVMYRYSPSTDTMLRVSDSLSGSLGGVHDLAWSPDGRYLAGGNSSGPLNGYLNVYKRTNDTLAKLPGVVTPPSSVSGVCWSPDGQYLAAAHVSSPYIALYKRGGDTFTKLPNPDILPPNNGYAITFSPDGNYLAIGHAAAPYLTIYKRSGDQFTRVAGSAFGPGGEVTSIDWSPDGKYIAIASATADPRVMVFKFAIDGTLSVAATPPSVPTSTTTDVRWSPDGRYLAASYWAAGTTCIKIWRFTNNPDAFALLPDITARSTNNGVSLSWSPNGDKLAMGIQEAVGFVVIKSALGPIPGAAIRADTPARLEPPVSP